MSNKSKQLRELLDALTETLVADEVIYAGLKAMVSATIAEKRLNLGMNQTEFATHMGVSQGLVSRWENGEENFTLENLSKIAQKLSLEMQNPFKEKPKAKHIIKSNIVPFPGTWHGSRYDNSANYELMEM